MKITKMSKEEMDELIKSGRAKKVHWGSCEDVLMPRGSMEKESIGLSVLERLESIFESYTDPSYSDNPDIGTLLFHLKSNLDSECQKAWNEFLKRVNSR